MNKKSSPEKNAHTPKNVPSSDEDIGKTSNDTFRIPIFSSKIYVTLAVIISLALFAGGYVVYSRYLRNLPKLSKPSLNAGSYIVCDKGTCIISPLFLHTQKITH